MHHEAEPVPRTIRAGTVVYRAMLRLYPHTFRRTYSDELESDFHEMTADALDAGGWPGVARSWMGAAGDLAISLPREWLRTPWIPVLTAAALVATLVFYGSMGRFHLAVRSDSNPPESAELLLLMALMVLIPVAVMILLWCTARFFNVRSGGPRRGA